MKNKIIPFAGLLYILFYSTSCNIKLLEQRTENRNIPSNYYVPLDTAKRYTAVLDTNGIGAVKWREFFTDTNLVALIDTALQNNQELNIMLREIQIAKNEVRARKGEYLPFVGAGGAAGTDRVARYTRNGALEANTDIKPGKAFPDPLTDLMGGFSASWEVDIWHKLHNAKDAAAKRYLATIEGKNFLVTQLVAEISNSYYELMALDNQYDILNKNIDILTRGLEIVKLQKIAARVTELAVRKFEAELFKNQSLLYYIQQHIVETENHINFLVGRYPQSLKRNSKTFNSLKTDSIQSGVPSHLLVNRPDIKQSELQLAAAKLDVKVARANFYPSLRISAATGLQAFDPKLLIAPESVLFSLVGDLAGPLINRNAIKAYYYSANARQIQTVYNYERTVLNAYVEVSNQLSNIRNLEISYDLKAKQVQTLTESITISYNLFKSARADYMEVLLTQRDGLEAKMELIETKKQQMNALVNVYKALGGGWR